MAVPLRIFIVITLTLLTGSIPGQCQTTEFTYQGDLASEGIPAQGAYDFRFVLFDSPITGLQVGGAQTNLSVPVNDGIFTTILDFGTFPFDGDPRWMEISVATNNSENFILLNPRQRITATPYAIRSQVAGGVSDGAITADMLANQAITSDKIASGSINSNHLEVAAVNNTHLAQNSITPEKLAPSLQDGIHDPVLNGTLSINLTPDSYYGYLIDPETSVESEVRFPSPFASPPHVEVEDSLEPTSITDISTTGFRMRRSNTGYNLIRSGFFPSGALINGTPAAAFTM